MYLKRYLVHHYIFNNMLVRDRMFDMQFDTSQSPASLFIQMSNLAGFARRCMSVHVEHVVGGVSPTY